MAHSLHRLWGCGGAANSSAWIHSGLSWRVPKLFLQRTSKPGSPGILLEAPARFCLTTSRKITHALQRSAPNPRAKAPEQAVAAEFADAAALLSRPGQQFLHVAVSAQHSHVTGRCMRDDNDRGPYAAERLVELCKFQISSPSTVHKPQTLHVLSQNPEQDVTKLRVRTALSAQPVHCQQI